KTFIYSNVWPFWRGAKNNPMARVRPVIWLLAVLLWAPPALAGPLTDKAAEPARAFAETLGYVMAAINHCGGPPAEVAQFERHALAMLADFTPDAVDRARLRDWAKVACQKAAPDGGDCTDRGGQALLGQLVEARAKIAETLGENGQR
ncbi:MAG: hypothetical protein ACPGVX_11545, partial [Thalassobaculaceae bacterium]